eukprot:1083809-Amphidinium_carterae.1
MAAPKISQVGQKGVLMGFTTNENELTCYVSLEGGLCQNFKRLSTCDGKETCEAYDYEVPAPLEPPKPQSN